MAGNESDKGARDEMAAVGKGHARPGARGEPGIGADPGRLAEGMSESGSGAPEDGGGGKGEGPRCS